MPPIKPPFPLLAALAASAALLAPLLAPQRAFAEPPAAPATAAPSAPSAPPAPSAPAAPAEDDAFAQFRASRAAARGGDFAAEVRHLEAAQRVVGSEPIFAFELARANARAGRVAEALRWLEPAVASGEAWQVDSDSNFAALHGQPAFEKLLPAIVASRQPAGSAEVAARLAEKDLLPEGIAWDAGSGALFVSSTYRRKIVRVDPGAAPRDFVGSGQDGLWGVVGMVVDPARKLLWVAHGNVGAGMPMHPPDPATVGASGLFAYDLASGELRRRYVAGGPGEPRFFNALALRPSDGAIFASDSLQGIYRFDPGAAAPLRLLSVEKLTFPNGIALSADEKKLYIAHLEGLTLLDLESGEKRSLQAPPGQPGVAGLDGLSADGDTLIGVFPSMQRVVRWQLADDGRRIAGAEILLGHHPAMQRPTTGVVGGGTFYLIANAQLQSHNGDGTLFPLEKLNEPTILAIRLAPANSARRPR